MKTMMMIRFKTLHRCVGLASMLAFLCGCSPTDVVRVGQIAVTGDIGAAESLARDKAIHYAANPKALERDIKRFKKNFEKLLALFKKDVQKEWGRDEVKIPQPKEYVKYTQNYLSRAAVDFDRGLVTVETVDQENPLPSLKNAIVTTLLTPDDPRAVDLYSAKTVALGQTPFLYQEVLDQDNQAIRWAWRAERYADHLIQTILQTRPVRNADGGKTVHFVVFPMIKDSLETRARKYRAHVERFAQDYRISKNLIYAIMKTESNFNPFAVSSAPAFGLMQIVPMSAGRDVNRFLNKSGLPSKDFLFKPDNNIQYGTIFLHLLDEEYLNAIENQVARQYCIIAAYNTGAGNVLRTFDRERSKAQERINRLTPLEVYDTLRAKLPHDETRRYLAKVVEAQKDFVNF
jgi:membrane-bound lytic murein transglycosylase C